ncbi:radical SAM protein [Variovorax rhizosphaerae]|uniref:Radical SAM protein n=1 Tax=Variovorax rhizosphaerae TaxID=1836200 RepID=A0ABU8WJG4_9BURK
MTANAVTGPSHDVHFRVLIVFPGSKTSMASASGLGGVLIRSLMQLCSAAPAAQSRPLDCAVAGFDAATNTVLEPSDDWHRGDTSPWARSRLEDLVLRLRHERAPRGRAQAQVIVFASSTYILRGQPGLDDMLRRSMQHGMAGVGNISDGVHAFAMAKDRLWLQPSLAALLHALCMRTPNAGSADLPALHGEDNCWHLPPAYGPDASPALRGRSARAAFSTADAPAYLNTAIAEAMESPILDESLQRDVGRLRNALIAQRDSSAVRWVFNELLNITEFRTGHTRPASVPPEVHIAVSGRCNIECRFCSYSHKAAGRDFVTLSKLMNFELLRDIRTLRLHSGNGEPTVNPELPALIDYVTHAHPHVGMNFFTNGILLNDQRLVDVLVRGHVNWINVSLNAATREEWKRLCGTDQFDRVLRGVERLHEAKLAHGAVTPVVYASMVLTKESVFELPRMPALCRRLGMDRLTAIPFFSLGYERDDRFGPEDAYHHIGAAYDGIYRETLEEAQRWEVSVELPPPQDDKKAAFGTETRTFRDFAQVECNGNPLEMLLSSWAWAEQRPCQYLWRQAGVGIAAKGQSPHPGGNFLYPCLGPLATVNFAPYTPVVFSDRESFMNVWRNPVFTRLREGQTQLGKVQVCDACRGNDTRAPSQMIPMQLMLSRFVREHGLQ